MLLELLDSLFVRTVSAACSAQRFSDLILSFFVGSGSGTCVIEVESITFGFDEVSSGKLFTRDSDIILSRFTFKSDVCKFPVSCRRRLPVRNCARTQAFANAMSRELPVPLN